jgi:hypothetical protein
MSPIHKEERREGYAEVPHAFITEVKQHIVKEEERQRHEERREKEMTEALQEGSRRMKAIETDLAVISGVVSTASGFIKATKLVSTVLGALILLFAWIMLEKNQDIKEMQVTLNKHTVQNTEMLALLKYVMESDARQTAIIDKHSDKLMSAPK